MPKGFSEREKRLIHTKLIEKGGELFSMYGLRKTNIEDLTRAAGISKGAFYIFFPSKEELYLEIIEQYEREFRESIFKALALEGKSPRARFKDVLRYAFSTWRSTPLLGKFDKEEYEYLLRKLPAEKVQAHVHSDTDFVTQLVAFLESVGIHIEQEPRTVAGLMNALFFVAMHEEDFGKDIYPDTMETLICIIADFLVKD